MTDTTRDAFEKWFTTGDAGVRLHRVGDDYTLMTSQISWNAWQAATEQGKRQPLTRAQVQAMVIEVCDAIYPQDDASYSEADTVFYGAFAHAIEAAHNITATQQGKI